MRRSLVVGWTWLLLCVPVFAQTLGTITGEVKDSTGAVIPGVTVTVTNKATNATRTTTTNEVGLFDFPALPPGSYVLKSDCSASKPAPGARDLRAGASVRVHSAGELATFGEEAAAPGVPPLVETRNARGGPVIETRRIVELPLNGRSYLQLVALSPNVS